MVAGGVNRGDDQRTAGDRLDFQNFELFTSHDHFRCN